MKKPKMRTNMKDVKLLCPNCSKPQKEGVDIKPKTRYKTCEHCQHPIGYSSKANK